MMLAKIDDALIAPFQHIVDVLQKRGIDVLKVFGFLTILLFVTDCVDNTVFKSPADTPFLVALHILAAFANFVVFGAIYYGMIKHQARIGIAFCDKLGKGQFFGVLLRLIQVPCIVLMFVEIFMIIIHVIQNNYDHMMLLEAISFLRHVFSNFIIYGLGCVFMKPNALTKNI